MNLQGKRLLILVLSMMILLMLLSGRQTTEPVQDEDRPAEMEMQPVPDTRPASRETAAEVDAVLDEVAQLPLSGVAEEAPVASQSDLPDAATLPGLTDADRTQLRERGLQDPEQRILNSLAGRNDLLPRDGATGTALRFLPEESRVLNRRWVLATYAADNLRGQSLLEYEVTTTGEILWVVLAHYSE